MVLFLPFDLRVLRVHRGAQVGFETLHGRFELQSPRFLEAIVMSHAQLLIAVLTVVAGVFVPQPTNDLPNPYQTVANYFKLPDGRTWGSTSAVEIDKDGTSIWVGERCGVNRGAEPAAGKMSPLDTGLKLDRSCRVLKNF